MNLKKMLRILNFSFFKQIKKKLRNFLTYTNHPNLKKHGALAGSKMFLSKKKCVHISFTPFRINFSLSNTPDFRSTNAETSTFNLKIPIFLLQVVRHSFTILISIQLICILMFGIAELFTFHSYTLP